MRLGELTCHSLSLEFWAGFPQRYSLCDGEVQGGHRLCNQHTCGWIVVLPVATHGAPEIFLTSLPQFLVYNLGSQCRPQRAAIKEESLQASLVAQ